MFKNRFDAGKQLAQKLEYLKETPDTIVVAIPNGGVPVGYELARGLSVPLQVMLSKKIGHPDNSDYTIGAVSLDHVIVDKRALEISGIMEDYLKTQISLLRQNLREEATFYQHHISGASIENSTIILVDDGIATGKNMEITIDLVKRMQPCRLIIAVPIASKQALQLIKKKADEVICLHVPELFITKSHWFQEFDYPENEHIAQMLQEGYGSN